MGRPSPRTQGVDEEGLPFQKFGTQQLKFIDPAKPALGVTQIDTGKQFKGFTTSGYTGTKTTVFSERFQAGITGAVPVELHDEAVQRQKEKLEEMGIPQIQFPDLTKLFPPASPNGETCTDCDSDKCVECNAWDLQCEDCKKKDGTCTPPRSEECGCLPYDFGCEIGCWWEKNKNYVYLIGGLIGLGVLLWLLRPLFGMIGAFKGGSP